MSASITTQSNRSFIESQQYSDFILRNMYEPLLGSVLYRNVTDFGSGEVLDIKTIGEATLQEITEDQDITFNPIESGSVQMRITDYIGDGFAITDKMRQDGSQVEALLAARSQEGSRKLGEYIDTQILSTLESGQTDADANAINGFAHRVASAESNNVAVISHFQDMKLAFDKADVPAGGRIAIVDPVVATTLERAFQGNYNVDSNPTMQAILNKGLVSDHQFVMNFAGWSIVTSNRLPKGSLGDGTTTVTNGVANLFLCIADDQCKPLMFAERQAPKTEVERNKNKQRDEYVMTTRFGFGVQRVDTLGVLITDATAVA